MSPRTKRNITWVALAVGVALLVGAIINAATEVKWEQLEKAEPWQVAALAGAVFANLIVSAMLWWAVTLSFDTKPRVGLGRMFALVCASALFNYLPLKAGLVGRTAFLKMKHNLPLRQSFWIFVIIMIVSVVVLGGAALIVVSVPPHVQYEVSLAAGVLATILLPVVTGRMLKRKIVAGWLWTPLRVADVLATGVRLWVAFRIVGHPIDFGEAVLVGVAGQFISQLGITPNGLGLREWAIAGMTSATAGHIGFAAAVVDRGVEAIVITLTGLWSMQSVSLAKVEEAKVKKK